MSDEIELFNKEELDVEIYPRGPQGEPGPKGDKGDKGDAGEKGDTGANGQDGYTPVRGVDYFTTQDISVIETDVISVVKNANDLTYYYTKNEVDDKISSVYKYKGTVATYNDLPENNLTIGDVYNVESDGSNYAWTGNVWDKLGGDIDLSGYQIKIDSTHKLNSDLVDDTNNTNKFVTSQEKTTWNNKSDFSGSYNDLTNKPTIPSALSDLSDDTTHRLVSDTEKTTWNGKQNQLTAGTNISISNENIISATDTTYDNATTETAGLMSSSDKTKLNGIASGAGVNVQANWNETDSSSDSYIQNKPVIPTVPTNVSAFNNDAGYTTNTGTITGVTMNGASKGTSGTVDLGTVITEHQDISGKEDTSNKVTSLSANSTDTQYPSAKCVYDLIGNISTVLSSLVTVGGGN